MRKLCVGAFLLLCSAHAFAQYGRWVSPTPVNATDAIQLPSGTLLVASDKLIFRSSDHGTTWAKIPLANDSENRMFAVGGGAVVVRNARSVDDGQSWSPLPMRFRSIICDSDGVLYGLQRGTSSCDVLQSKDGGSTWLSYIEPANMGAVDTIEIGGRNWLLGYDSTYGLRKWDGTAWAPFIRDSMGLRPIVALGGSRFVALSIPVLVSADSGVTWLPDWWQPHATLACFLPPYIVYGEFAYLYRSDDTGAAAGQHEFLWTDRLRALHSLPDGRGLMCTSRGLEIFDTSLHPYSLLGGERLTPLVCASKTGAVFIYGGGYDPTPPLSYTTNDGLSWQIGTRSWIAGVDSEGTLYDANLRSVDNGVTWDSILPTGWRLTAVLPDGRVIAEREHFGAVVSRDRGQTWDSLLWTPGLPYQLQGVSRNNWYVRDQSLVYYSNDKGAAWHSLPPLPSLRDLVGSVFITENGYVFASDDSITWRCSEDDHTWKPLPRFDSMPVNRRPYFNGYSSMVESNGWLFSGMALASSDYGDTWHSVPFEFDSNMSLTRTSSGLVLGVGTKTVQQLEDAPTAGVKRTSIITPLLNVRPNPVSSILVVETEQPLAGAIEVHVFNEAKQLALTATTEGSDRAITLDVHSLPAGIYTFTTSDPRIFGKFVKK